jgi:hypothetical protein
MDPGEVDRKARIDQGQAVTGNHVDVGTKGAPYMKEVLIEMIQHLTALQLSMELLV